MNVSSVGTAHFNQHVVVNVYGTAMTATETNWNERFSKDYHFGVIGHFPFAYLTHF
jgi:hypothetical protein